MPPIKSAKGPEVKPLNEMPEIPPPLVKSPCYWCWLMSAIVLVILLKVFLPWKGYEAMISLPISIGVLGLWLAIFIVRLLIHWLFRWNEKNEAIIYQQQLKNWWAHHRRKAALVETVLLAPACRTRAQRQALFSPDHKPLNVTQTPEGAVLRMPGILATNSVERECELARQLVVNWRTQRGEFAVLQPMQFYWQGSPQAWQALVDQMAITYPQVSLPAQPELWQGVDSLGSIIDQLHDAPADARILCAGCQSSAAAQDSKSPAGEAALLWMLGREGDVRLSRGEWYVVGVEDLAEVAGRALQQSELATPADTCVSFFHTHVPDLSAIGWNARHHLLDAQFGDLAGLAPMVVQTLAATCAHHQQAPCAWLTSDPHYALALGIVHPEADQ